MGGQYTQRARPVYGSGHAALELEEVVEFREDEEKAQLLVGTPQAHREPTLRRFALDQHQRPHPVVAERAVRRILQGRNTRAATALTTPPSSGIPYLKRDNPGCVGPYALRTLDAAGAVLRQRGLVLARRSITWLRESRRRS